MNIINNATIFDVDRIYGVHYMTLKYDRSCLLHSLLKRRGYGNESCLIEIPRGLSQVIYINVGLDHQVIFSILDLYKSIYKYQIIL